MTANALEMYSLVKPNFNAESKRKTRIQKNNKDRPAMSSRFSSTFLVICTRRDSSTSSSDTLIFRTDLLNFWVMKMLPQSASISVGAQFLCKFLQLLHSQITNLRNFSHEIDNK